MCEGEDKVGTIWGWRGKGLQRCIWECVFVCKGCVGAGVLVCVLMQGRRRGWLQAVAGVATAMGKKEVFVTMFTVEFTPRLTVLTHWPQ